MTCYFRFDSKHRPVLMWVSHMRTLQHPRVHGRNFGAGQLSAARSHTPVVSISIQNDPPPEPTVRAHPCQVCERLVDSNMSHGVSIKMIVEAFNPTMPQHLRNLFKPTSSIQLPSQAPMSSSRPVTAAASASTLSHSSPDGTRGLQERPFTANIRPATSYGDAGVSEGDSAEQYMPAALIKLKACEWCGIHQSRFVTLHLSIIPTCQLCSESMRDAALLALHPRETTFERSLESPSASASRARTSHGGIWTQWSFNAAGEGADSGGGRTAAAAIEHVKRIGSRPSTQDARGELQRPQTTAAAERGRAGGAVYVPQLSLHSVHQSSGASSSRGLVRAMSDRKEMEPWGGHAHAPSAPSTARSSLRTPRTSRQQQQHQQQQQQDSASAGALLRERLMQGMGEEERMLLLKALSGL